MRLPREDGFRSEHRVKKKLATKKKFSKQKRQIIISNAMQRAVPNKLDAKEINLAEVLRNKEVPLNLLA